MEENKQEPQELQELKDPIKSILVQFSSLNTEEISWLRGFVEGYYKMLSEELEQQKKMFKVLEVLNSLGDNNSMVRITGVMSNGDQKKLDGVESSLENAKEIIQENESRMSMVGAIITKLSSFDGIADSDNLLEEKPIA